jgi:hypothetical protein
MDFIEAEKLGGHTDRWADTDGYRDLDIMLMLRIRGPIPRLSHTPSWRCLI